jgi:hypothetical protein
MGADLLAAGVVKGRFGRRELLALWSVLLGIAMISSCSAPEALPPGSEIAQAVGGAPQCSPVKTCGNLGYVDCQSAMDGPAYYFERATGKVVGYCGGFCWTPSEERRRQCRSRCPPPEWTCSTLKVRD